MKMKVKILAYVLAASALSSIGISVFAAEVEEVTETPIAVITETVESKTFSPAADRIYHHPILSQLNLTEQQKAQLVKIEQVYGSQRPLLNNQQRQTLANLRHARENLVLNRQFDGSRAREVIAQEQNIWAQQRQAMTDFQFRQLQREHAIYQVLTPYQQQRYLQLRQQQKDQHQKDLYTK